jgi:hypothetical protein
MTDENMVLQVEAVRKTVTYLHTTLSAANEVASEEVGRTIGKLLQLLDEIIQRPDMILGLDATPVVSGERKFAAVSMIAVANLIVERGMLLNKSIEASAEMGFNMLSQQGMVAALRWVNNLLLENARNLAPDDLEVQGVPSDSALGKEVMRASKEATKSVDEELEDLG